MDKAFLNQYFVSFSCKMSERDRHSLTLQLKASHWFKQGMTTLIVDDAEVYSSLACYFKVSE